MNYNQYRSWITIVSKRVVGKRMSDAADLIAKSYRSFAAYEKWFELENRYRHHNHDESMKRVYSFVRKSVQNFRLIRRARGQGSCQESKTCCCCVCSDSDTSTKCQGQSRAVGKSTSQEERLETAQQDGTFGKHQDSNVELDQDQGEEKKARALNHIIRSLQLWHYEHEYKREREAALAIQSWYYYRKHFKSTLNEWRQDAEAAALNGRSGELQKLLLRADKKWISLRRFLNIVNMRDRLRGTSLLYTAVCADADARTQKYMAQFLMDCGAKLWLRTTSTFRPGITRRRLRYTPPWSVESDLPLSKFLLRYAVLHGESKKEIMQKHSCETNYTLVDSV